MNNLLNLLLGGRTSEEILKDIGTRIRQDAARGTIYDFDIVHEEHFSHGALHPIPVAYRHMPKDTTNHS